MPWATKIDKPRQVRYWTKERNGCLKANASQLQPIVWTGRGLEALGRAVGQAAAMDQVKVLCRGRHPDTGRLLRRPKFLTHKDAMLSGVLFAAAVRDQAARAGLEPGEVFAFPTARKRWRRLENALAKLKARDAGVPVKDLEMMARATGVDLAQVYLPEDLARARANRHRRTSGAAPAIGVTINFTKSLSQLIFLAPPDLAAELLEEVWAVAHECHAFLEDYSTYGLTGHQGDGQRAARIGGRGLAGALTLHPLARPVDPTTAGDPQIHFHLVIVNALLCDDGKWRASGPSMFDAFRYIPALGEFAKARLRQRTRARFGLRWERDPVTDEWEIAGFTPQLRARYSRRADQITTRGQGLAPRDRRRMARRVAGREQPGDTARAHKAMASDEELMDGLGGILAAALSADPGQRPVMPSVAQLVRAMRMPQFAVGRDKGVERREILTALLAAIPDTLVSREQAEALTDAVVESAGFTLLSRPLPGSHHTATERYRVPPALVATARAPIGARTAAVAPAKTVGRVKDDDQEQQLVLFATDADAARRPASVRRRRTAPQLAPPRHVDLDLGSLDPVSATTAAPGGPARADTSPTSPAPAPALEPLENREYGLLLDADLGTLIAEQQDLVDLVEQSWQDQLADDGQALMDAELGRGPGRRRCGCAGPGSRRPPN